MSRRSYLAAVLLVVVLGLAGVWRLQAGIDRQLATIHQERDDLLLRSGRLVRALSLEYQTFLADVYWTRAVQYYGDKHFHRDANLELLWPLLDLSTSLDPQLQEAYRFGSIFLAQSPPDGAGRPDQAIALIQRGIAANPEEWRLYHDLGFVYYWNVHDYQKASEAFLEGSKNPKALFWMKVLAAKVAGEGQSYETSMFLWRQVYESSKDPDIRKNALYQMRELKAEQDVEQLNELLFAFEQQNMRLAAAWDELVPMGLLAGVPLDPLGVPYQLDSSGRAQLSPSSPLAHNPPNPRKTK